MTNFDNPTQPCSFEAVDKGQEKNFFKDLFRSPKAKGQIPKIRFQMVQFKKELKLQKDRRTERP